MWVIPARMVVAVVVVVVVVAVVVMVVAVVVVQHMRHSRRLPRCNWGRQRRVQRATVQALPSLVERA